MASLVVLPTIACPICGAALQVTTTSSVGVGEVLLQIHLPAETTGHISAHWN